MYVFCKNYQDSHSLVPVGRNNLKNKWKNNNTASIIYGTLQYDEIKLFENCKSYIVY